MKSFALGLSAVALLLSGVFSSAVAYPARPTEYVEKVIVIKKDHHRHRPVVVHKKVVIQKVSPIRHREVRRVMHHKPHHARFDNHRRSYRDL